MMTTVVALGLLTGPYLILTLVNRLLGRPYFSASLRGCLGLTAVLIPIGVAHFVIPDQIAAMLPPWTPERVLLVYLTGVLELVAAGAILWPRWRKFVGWGLIAMFIVYLPVNIYAALERIPVGGHEGGLAYLVHRIPLQFVLIGWTWWFACRSTERAPVD